MKVASPKGMGRRQFALGLGAHLLAAPFVSLLGREAKAEPAGKADRLIVFFSPNGTVHQHWRPMGGETDFQFAPNSILEPLAMYKSDLVVLDGLDFVGVHNHEAGMANMLTGGQGGIAAGKSVDQYVASQISKGTRFASLEFGVETSAWGGSVQTRMCYAGPGSYVVPEDDPVQIYGRIYGKAAGMADPMRALARKRSVLDNIRKELGELSGQLGKAEQIKLEQHLTSLRSVEDGLSVGVSCGAPQAPMQLAKWDHKNFPAIGKTQTDLMLGALACGITKVASIQWSHTVGPHVFSWIGENEGHHELSHKGDSNVAGVASFVKCERWMAGQFAYLLGKLKSTPDPVRGGSLLDSSLVLWAKELGDSRLHTCQSVPFILAGKAGGALKTGRYLRYKGAPHQQLLTSICQLMGLSNTTFGDASKGSGTLPGLLG